MFKSDVSTAAAQVRPGTSVAALAPGDAGVLSFDQLLDALGEGVYGVDRDGRCTFVNRKALDLLGYGVPGDLISRHMHDVVHHMRSDGSAYPAHECPLLRTLRDGLPVILDEELLCRSDGTSFLVECISHPTMVDGVAVGSVIRFDDLSSRREARLQLAVQ